MGKAILYLPGGIVLALFPMVAKNHSNNIESLHLVGQAALATIVMAALVAAGYWFFSDRLMHFFYGEKYLDGGFLLRWYGIAIFPMALLMVAEHFLIAQGKTTFCWAYLFVLPSQFLVLTFWHQELWMVLLNIGVGGVVMTAVAYGILFRTSTDNLQES
jgi:O-antigen/teichoic acid export membrane protein